MLSCGGAVHYRSFHGCCCRDLRCLLHHANSFSDVRPPARSSDHQLLLQSATPALSLRQHYYTPSYCTHFHRCRLCYYIKTAARPGLHLIKRVNNCVWQRLWFVTSATSVSVVVMHLLPDITMIIIITNVKWVTLGKLKGFRNSGEFSRSPPK